MFLKPKTPRTKIADLPEMAAKLSVEQLRIVSGGLRAIFSCNARVATTRVAAGSRLGEPTDWNTNGDHDSD